VKSRAALYKKKGGFEEKTREGEDGSKKSEKKPKWGNVTFIKNIPKKKRGGKRRRETCYKVE